MKASARRCLGVDIGSTSLKVAELSQDRTGVIIQRLVEAPLDVSPDTPSETRWATISQTLRDVLRANKISTRQAAFALPGHAVFVRRVRLPRTSEERLERIIKFEARQQIPFPLDQTLLQYQIASTDVEDEVEVLLVAIKRDIVEHYMGMLRRLGLRPTRLGVSSFGLFNFHMFDEGAKPEEFDLEAPVPTALEAAEELEEPEEEPEEKEADKKTGKPGFLGGLKGRFGKKAKGAKATGDEAEPEATKEGPAELEPLPEIEEVKAYINIGASTIDLAIGRTGGSKLIGFSRSIPLAGNQLTRAIQERCGCESFAEAERVKRERTMVLTDSVSPPGDRYNEDACRAIMPTIDRIVAEIRRSLDFYISQPDGMAVDRLVLSGGQSALPNLPEYFEDRLNVPVEIAREVNNPLCRSNVRADTQVTNFLIGIGLAVQGLGGACIAIDFLPEHLKGWIEFKRKNLQLAVQLALVGTMIFVASMAGNRMSTAYGNVASAMNQEMSSRASLQKTFMAANASRFLIYGIVGTVDVSHGMREDYGLERDFMFDFLQKVLSIRPPDVSLQRFFMGPNGDFQIDAFLEQPRSAPVMTQDLGKLPDVDRAELTRSMQQAPGQRGRSGAQLYTFQITGKVKGKRSKIQPTPSPTIGPYGSRGWIERPTPTPRYYGEENES